MNLQTPGLEKNRLFPARFDIPNRTQGGYLRLEKKFNLQIAQDMPIAPLPSKISIAALPATAQT